MEDTTKQLLYEESLSKVFDYEGIVITSFEQLEGQLTNFVLLLKSPHGSFLSTDMIIYGVHEDGFVFEYEETDVEYVAFIKNMVRRVREPLLFGTIVKWNKEESDDRNRIIYKFMREKGIWETRATDTGRELRIGGVVRPDNVVFWNRFYPVKIPATMATQAEPNVWIHAWISVIVTGQNLEQVEVTFNLAEFDTFDVADQHRILEAPWLRNDSSHRYNMRAEPDPAEDDDDILVERTILAMRKPHEWRTVIEKQLGLFVGNHLIVTRDMPQYDFIIPVKMPYVQVQRGAIKDYPSAGDYLYFHAEWSSIHRSFLVLAVDREQQIMSHRVSASGNLRISVQPSFDYPGFFIDVKKNLSLIDDPGYYLTLLRYHPISRDPTHKAKVEVSAVRAIENTSVRYRIVKTDAKDEFTDNYQDWLQTCEISLEDVIGYSISEDTFISPDHPNIFFKDSENKYAAGMCIKFDAINKKGCGNEFQIIKGKSQEGHRSIIQCVKIYKTPSSLCQEPIILVRLTKSPYHNQLAYSKAFGYVDLRGKQDRITTDEFKCWIAESEKKNGKRLASTVMELYSLEICVPTGFPSAAKNAQRSASSAGNSSMMSHGSSSKRGFGGPTFRMSKNTSLQSPNA